MKFCKRILETIFSYLDLETLIFLKDQGFVTDYYLNFSKNSRGVFALTFGKKKFYVKTIIYCLFEGNVNFDLRYRLFLIDDFFLKYFKPLENLFKKKHHLTKIALIHLGSLKFLNQNNLNILDALTFLNCYFRRISPSQGDYDVIKRILYGLKTVDKSHYLLLKELIKILPECYFDLFASIVHKAKLFCTINDNEKFSLDYIKKYGKTIFKSCIRDEDYLNQLTHSVIVWNTKLLPILDNYNRNIVLLLVDNWIQLQYQGEVKVVVSLLTSNDGEKYNKIVKYLHRLKLEK